MPDDGALITMLGGYGDAFLALPSIREVARRFGSDRVHLVCPEAHIAAFFSDLDLNYVPIPPRRRSVPTADLGLLSVQEVISFNVYYPCEVDQIVGEIFADARWRGFFDRHGTLMVRPSVLVNKHKRDQYFEVLGLDAIYKPADRRMTLSSARMDDVASFCEEGCDPEGRCFYTLHLDTQDIKMWPEESWAAVVDHLWNRWRAWPLIIGKPSGSADVLMQVFPYARSMFAYSSIGDQACAIAAGRAFLGIDSLFAHIADSLEIPSVVIFGTFDIGVWGPVSATSSAIQAKAPRRLRDLDSARVIQCLDDTLAQALS